jgi:hypothetical protein
MQPLADLLLSISLQRQATCLAFNALTDRFAAVLSADAFFFTFLFFSFVFAMVFVIIARSQSFSKRKPGHHSRFKRGITPAPVRILHDAGQAFKISTYVPIEHDKCHFLIMLKKRKIARQACHSSM